jgi:hypothetical protein
MMTGREVSDKQKCETIKLIAIKAFLRSFLEEKRHIIDKGDAIFSEGLIRELYLIHAQEPTEMVKCVVSVLQKHKIHITNPTWYQYVFQVVANACNAIGCETLAEYCEDCIEAISVKRDKQVLEDVKKRIQKPK